MWNCISSKKYKTTFWGLFWAFSAGRKIDTGQSSKDQSLSD